MALILPITDTYQLLGQNQIFTMVAFKGMFEQEQSYY